MKRLGPVVFLFAAGCSNAPLAGTLDCLFPSKAGRGGGTRPADTDTLPPPNIPARPDDIPPRGTLQSNPRDRRDWDDDHRPGDRPLPGGLEDPLPAPLPAPGYIDPKK